MLIKKPKPSYSGFTLTELLLTICIAWVLVGMAVPVFSSVIRNQRLTVNANNLLSSLAYARNEAIKRSGAVVVQSKSGSGQWEQGWDIFADIDGNGQFNDDGDSLLCEMDEDCLLKTWAALGANYTLHLVSASGEGNQLIYQASGLMANPAILDFKLCDETQQARELHSRLIQVNAIGRAIVQTEGVNEC